MRGYADAIRDMLVFDALIYNEDRHFGNFGLLRNSHTGEVIAPAPLFDNGLSLFSFAMLNDYVQYTQFCKAMPELRLAPALLMYVMI